MAISYAFEGNCSKTIEYEQQVFDFYASTKNFFQQGEIADEAARVCLDSCVLGRRQQVVQDRPRHRAGRTDLKPARRDLWDFRWEHAQARIAARRRRAGRGAKACCRGKGRSRQGHDSRAGAVLPVPEGLRRVLCGGLQVGA